VAKTTHRCYFSLDERHLQQNSMWSLLDAQGKRNFNALLGRSFEIELQVPSCEGICSRDWAHPCPICTGTGLAPATSTVGNGLELISS
jgi:hypothetical protein